MSDIVSELQKKDTLVSYKNKKIDSQKVSFLPILILKRNSKKISDCSVTLWRETWQHISTEEMVLNFTVLIIVIFVFVLFALGVKL